MSKFVQKLFYNHFDKKNKNNSQSESDKLSQPTRKEDMSSEDISDNKKKLWKRIIVWSIVLASFGAIIAAIVVTSTKKTEISLGNQTTLVKTENPKVVNFVDGNRVYSVNLDPNSLVASYYGATSSQIYLQLSAINQSLPIEIMVSKNIINDLIQYSIADLTISVNAQNEIQNPNPDFEVSTLNDLNSLLMNAYKFATTASAGFNWLSLLSTLMPLVIIIIIFLLYFYIMKRQMGGMGQDSIFGMGKANTKPVKTNVRFSDVAGIDEVKTELSELVDYVKNPSKYAAMGARAPKGVILYGPPGTGKTLIAKAVAGEANCAFYAIAGSSFDDMLVGVGAKRVRDLFQKARKSAPSIIFIDEIDSVASKRGKNDVMGGSGLADQTINQLLAEMDGFTTDSGVIVIGATNRLDVLDDAILRPGRFDRQIQVTLPDIKGREEILKIHAKNKNISSSVNLNEVARRTPGFSGAQLENVLNEATLLAVRENKKIISLSDIDEAIDRVIGGPARHGRIITPHERKQIAYHEAGHALVGLHSENTEVVQKITIIPRGDAAGYTLQTPQEQEKVIQTKSDILNQVRMTLGGRASEELIFGKDNISSGAANDLYKVTNMVRAMVTQLGMTELGLTQFIPSEGPQNPYQKQYSESTAILIDQKIEEIIQKEYKLAKNIISKNKEELELIVETLLLLETIVKEQIDYIHEHLELPPEAIEAKNKLNENNG